MPVIQHITIDGVFLYYDDEDGTRWLIQNVNVEKDGELKLVAPVIATHRVFRSLRGEKKIYSFAKDDRRDSDEEHVTRQFRRSTPLS